MATIAAVVGRLLLALLFIVAGLYKISDPASAASMFADTNLPTSFIQPVGVFELAAGLLLAIGLMSRLVAFLLFVWVLLEIFFFYNDFNDAVQGPMALSLAAVAGGLLMVVAYGQMRGSYDHIRARRKTVDAELRAARAEGRVEGLSDHPAGTRVRH